MGEVQQFNQSESTDKEIPPAITIDGVLRELEYWRKNKRHPSSAIPDELWEKIFQLSDRYSSMKIRRLLDISKDQFVRKAKQLRPVEESQVTSAKQAQSTSVDFCEVKTKQPVYQAATIPALHTIIVEFRRSDGQLMKLHTTSENFKTIITLFFEMGHHAADHL